MIQGGILDFGYPRIGPLVLPGRYWINLKVGDAKYSAEVLLKSDPRQKVEAVTLRRQLSFALEVRDTITEVTRTVHKLRAVRKQLEEHREVFEKEKKALTLVEVSEGLIAKLDQLEGRLHNSEAEISYDILAMKGGAKLYARLDAIFNWVNEADGEPPEGMMKLVATQQGEVLECQKALEALLHNDLPQYNQTAAKLSLPTVYVAK